MRPHVRKVNPPFVSAAGVEVVRNAHNSIKTMFNQIDGFSYYTDAIVVYSIIVSKKYFK